METIFLNSIHQPEYKLFKPIQNKQWWRQHCYLLSFSLPWSHKHFLEQLKLHLTKWLTHQARFYVLVSTTNILLSMPYKNSRSPQGLGLSKIGKSCPLDVVVVERYSSLPLRFMPVNPKKGVIRISTDLNIMFPPNVTCPHHSTV